MSSRGDGPTTACTPGVSSPVSHERLQVAETPPPQSAPQRHHFHSTATQSPAAKVPAARSSAARLRAARASAARVSVARLVSSRTHGCQVSAVIISAATSSPLPVDQPHRLRHTALLTSRLAAGRCTAPSERADQESGLHDSQLLGSPAAKSQL